MARTRKTWREKLADAKAKPGLPKKFFCDKSRQNFVVASPQEIESIIQAIPRGRLMTIAEMSRVLRERHGVDVACPITTGIFTWLIANAADEAAGEAGAEVRPPAGATGGAKRRTPASRAPAGTPWWRVLKTGGLLNPKFPGGGAKQKALLEAEGHKVVPKGKHLIVAGYEDSLAKLG